MKNTKLESISEEMFDTLEPEECLTATGGNTVFRTIVLTHVGGHADILEDVRVD
ncbi:MAG TPA: hypothetical protein VEZ90_17925 [Blastocatellia bacterium]|nr:hypothetical protein [Blastocatellia bacterium]